MALAAAASSLGGATPWGAIGGALSSAASTPNTSATGDVSTGAINVGGLNIGATGSNQALMTIAPIAVALLVLLVMRGR